MGVICISGAGPAGMICGLLLARKGHRVIVLEAQKDFHREFRGEVLMPLFSQMMDEVGLLEPLLQAEHLKLEDIKIFNQKKEIASVRIEEVCNEFPFAIWMPQPIMLNRLYEMAKVSPNFELWFSSSVKNISENPEKHGLEIEIRQGHENKRIQADLAIGAEGRWSHLRKILEMPLEFESHGFDIVWFEIPRPKDHPRSVQGFFSSHGNFLIVPKYPDLLQCGLLVQRGEFDLMKKQGLEWMKNFLSETHSAFTHFANSLVDFNSFHLLQAKIARAKKWAENRVVLIGDAAHTMSPIGAIGVSEAAGTAIVAADVIDSAFQAEDFSDEFLSKISHIRLKDVMRIQSFQLAAERTIQTGSKWRRSIFIRLLPILIRLGVLQRLMRSVLTLRPGWRRL